MSKKKGSAKDEKLSREDIEDLMGVNRSTYKKVKGRVRQNEKGTNT